MALADIKAEDIFNKNTGGDKDGKTIDSAKETEITTKFDNGEHITDHGMFENLAPALYAVQQVADDIKELRRHVVNDVTKWAYIPIVCNFYGDINTESYVPFSDGETESTANSNRRNQFIAPFDGQFHKAIFRSNQSLLEKGKGVTLTVKSKKVNNNSSTVNDLETETVTTTAAENFMEVTFSSSSAFNKGDRLLMSMDLPGAPKGSKNWFVTVIFKIDQTT
jgi:hypothetical protein